jgi:hypothetical protein
MQLPGKFVDLRRTQDERFLAENILPGVEGLERPLSV